jgi:hypothetical protein
MSTIDKSSVSTLLNINVIYFKIKVLDHKVRDLNKYRESWVGQLPWIIGL